MQNLPPDLMLAALRVQYGQASQAVFQQGQIGMPAIPPAPVVHVQQPAAPSQGSGSAAEASAPAQEPASRLQQMREEKARKEAAEKADTERLRCHLHKKPNNKCKNCQRFKDFVEKGKEEKAALKEKFIAKIREKGSENRNTIGEEDTGLISRPLEIANKITYGFPPLLQSHIVESQHFRTVMAMEKFDNVVDELYAYADGIEPYAQNQSQAPSALFVCVYRLFCLGIDGRQLRQLLESTDNPYVRCAGILFVRYGLSPDQLWPWLGEYVLDEEEFPPGKEYELGSTIGEYVESVLSQDFYYKTVLPRLPQTTKRFLDTKLAQVPQYRKRSQANQHILEQFRVKGLRVEACLNEDEWAAGETVDSHLRGNRSRLKVRIRWEAPRSEQSREQDVHIGKVILADDTGSATGSRGGVADWSRDKGRLMDELLEDLRNRKREQAVCNTGKDYAKRPVSFQVACPMDQGSASHNLIREETLVHQKSKRGARDRSRSPMEERKKAPSLEHQARQKALFEKYGAGAQKAGQDAKRGNEVDKPDVMRLG